ncbi:hypothetical protein JRO89_XS14G0098100 [Xanthoceras sorbifolium]|uniref:Uncharacterized protein n=1 Tax=Xanthoceras sorbifolium TaxID=99658 RepID=A0ABQ8H4T1_9ROSI|nr:hypothetical protein JRO89_XS14G0098100 [Xanthoceras sorbifolium]
MEDIEGLLAGSSGGGALPGFRLPINSVGVKPRENNKKNKPPPQPTTTQLDYSKLSKVDDQLTPFSPQTKLAKTKIAFSVKIPLTQSPSSPEVPGTQTIYIKTFGCSHNQKIVELAHAHGALVLVDNNIMSPVLSQPLELGAVHGQEVTEDLVRLFVGIEDVNDLIAGLDNALGSGP